MLGSPAVDTHGLRRTARTPRARVGMDAPVVPDSVSLSFVVDVFLQPLRR